MLVGKILESDLLMQVERRILAVDLIMLAVVENLVSG